MELLETPLTNLTPFLPFFTEILDSGVKMVESTPLRDRMAMYQAAVTKHDFPSSPTVSDNPPLHHKHSLRYSLWCHHIQKSGRSADMTLYWEVCHNLLLLFQTRMTDFIQCFFSN